MTAQETTPCRFDYVTQAEYSLQRDMPVTLSATTTRHHETNAYSQLGY